MDIMQQLEQVDKQLGEAVAAEQSAIVEEAAQEAPALVEEPESASPAAEPERPSGDDVVGDDDEEDEPKPAKQAKDYVRDRRQSRKELEQELINERAEKAALRAMVSLQPKAEEAKPAAPEPMPDPQRDPDAYQARVVSDMANQLKATQEQLAKISRDNLQAQGKAELAAVEAEFSKRAPDYAEVMADAEARMERVIRLQNPNATELQIRQQIEADKMQGAIAAVAAGKNPAEAMYNRVKALFAYEPKAAKPAVKSEAEKLNAVAKNKQMAGNGMTSGGSSTQGHLSKDALMRMTPAQYAKLSDAERNAFMQ